MYSPTALNTYIDCPYKYYLAYVVEAKPIPKKEYEYGKTVHKLIATYYNIIPDRLTTGEIPLFLAQAIHKSGETIDDVEVALRGFRKFEENRLTWNINSRPVHVEKYFERGMFKGIVDVIFKKLNGSLVGIDWKSSWELNIKNVHYIIQGFIYIYIAQLDEMIFVPIFSGKEIKVTRQELIEFKNIVKDLIEGIRQKKFNKSEGEQCRTCEYSLACKLGENYWEV